MFVLKNQECKDMNLEEINILKAQRVYVDNSKNRRKHRVGQPYGGPDSKPEDDGVARKGDLVEVIGPMKQKVRGKFVETRTRKDGSQEYVVHIKGNEYFSGVSIAQNLSADERAAARKEKQGARDSERISALKDRMKELDKLEERTRLDMEQDPDVLENMDDGNHPAVRYYADLLTAIDKKKGRIREQLASLSPEE